MNHTHLRAFHAVASYQSFTKAAAILHLTQPTLSDQVKALETQYGVRLFERRGRVLELTELGRALFEGTQRLFALEADLEQQLSAFEAMARLRHPCRTIGIAVNTRYLTSVDALAAIDAAEQRFGLPACDVYRTGAQKLVHACIHLRKELLNEME